MVMPGAVGNQFPKFLRRGAALLSMAAAFGSFTASAEANYDPNLAKFPKALGEQTLAMVPVNFDGQAPLPFDNDVIENQTFEALGSVADYYNKASFGQFTLRGEVIGPVTVSPTVLEEGCDSPDLVKLGASANLAAQAEGHDMSGFMHYGYTLPRTEATKGCDFGGMSFGNGFVNLETRAKLGLTPHMFYEGIVAHELGHGFGLSHANSLRCRDRKGHAAAYSIARFIDGRCKEVQYGDPVDLMGEGEVTAGTPSDISAINKARLGWLKPQNIQTIKHNGVAHIAPLEAQTDQPQLVRVADGLKVNNKPHYFYMDVRQPINLDSNISSTSPLVQGVYIREAGPINDTSAEPLNSFTVFIDTTPKTPSAIDGTLASGKTFKDISTGISIKTLSIGPEGAEIRVSGLKSKSHKS